MTELDAARLARIETMLGDVIAEQARRRRTEDLILRALANMGQRLGIDQEIATDLRELATARRERDTVPAPSSNGDVT